MLIRLGKREWLSTGVVWLAVAACGGSGSHDVATPDVTSSGDTNLSTGGNGEGVGGSQDTQGGNATAGAMSMGGSAGAAGTSDTEGGNGAVGASDLPVPAGAADVPKPSGATASLSVLDWAGFKGAVSYTLDDTSPSQITNWEAIKATGVNITYYVTTQNQNAAFDAALSDAAASGSELGNHTQTHPNFDAATAASELGTCTDYILNNLGQSAVWTMAYPFGDTGYKAAARERFFLARGVGGGMVSPNDDTDPFNLPTIGASGGEAASVFNGHIDAAREQGQWATFLFHSILPENFYAGVELSTITDSIEYGKGLGDVWLDSVVNVGAYWIGQKTLTSVTPTGNGSAQSWTWSLPANFPPNRYLRVTVDGGTLSQAGTPLPWDGHGYYEVALDIGSLNWMP